MALAESKPGKAMHPTEARPAATQEAEAEVIYQRLDDLPRRTPVVTFALVALISAIAGLQYFLAGGHLDGSDPAAGFVGWALGAKVPSLVAQGEWWRLVTASFLHATWLHLSLNVFGLLFLGWMTESYFGRMRTVLIFVLTAVCGTAVSYALTPRVSLGASTGIMGLFGALVVHHFENRRILPERSRQIYPVLLVMLFVQVVVDRVVPRTDAFAHLGGLAGGMLLGGLMEGRLAWSHFRSREWLPLPITLAASVGLIGYGIFGLATTLPQRADLFRAARTSDPTVQADILQRVAERNPRFTELTLQVVEMLRQQGRHDEAARLIQKLPGRAQGASLPQEQQGKLEQVATDFVERGKRAMDQGRFEEALIDFRRAGVLSSDPSLRSTAYNDHAWVLAEHLRRDLAEAERYAISAAILAPKSSVIADTVAWVYYRQGRYKEALFRQLEAMKLAEAEASGFQRRAMGSAEAAELPYHLGVIYEKLGRRGEAVAAYNRACEMRRPYPEAETGISRLAPPTPAPVVPLGPRPPLDPNLDPAIRRGIL